MGFIKELIRYGVNNLEAMKHRSGSTHVTSNRWSARALSDIYDFLHFRNKDYGTTKKYLNAYSRNGLVYMVVNKLASNAASLPRIYHNEEGEVIENSEIELLLKNPNNFQSEIEFRQTINEYLTLSGNAYIRSIAGIGAGHELEVLNSANVTILIDSVGGVAGYGYIDNMGKRHDYEAEDILHIKMSNSLDVEREQKYLGLSPLKALWTVIESSNDLFQARASIWKNKGIIGIITNKSDVPLLPKERDQLQEKFDEDIGGAHKANKAHVTSGDLAFIQTGMSPADLKLLEGNTDNLRMISSGYKMPSVLFNDVENSTYNNVLESKKDAYTDAYIPLANKVDDPLSIWLSDKLGVTEVIVVDVSKIDVLKLTTHEVANRINAMAPQMQVRVVGQMSHEEVREMVGLGLLEGGQKIIGDLKGNNNGEKETND